MVREFKLISSFKPSGDQPKAIKQLVDGIKKGCSHQTLLGVTGSGKTFTIASVVEEIQKPTLVIAHNKTLAAQLAQEYRSFFPDNAVHYFVSYYDYYQPEAYMPVTDTYIEKEAQINEEIDRLRHASTQALLTRRDVIIVASVSCIYGLGSPEEYEKEHLKIQKGDMVTRAELIRRLVAVFYERANTDLRPGKFRAVGNTIEIMPVNERMIYRLEVGEGAIRSLLAVDAITRRIVREEKTFFLFPAKHFVTDKERLKIALANIKSELQERLKQFEKEGKALEAERLRRRTNHDLALLREIGYVNGIENYSRHLSGRAPGSPPATLLDYFRHGSAPRPPVALRGGGSALPARHSDGAGGRGFAYRDFLTIIDESHVTVPQIGGMYEGDASRKKTLIEHGFRLPSARDNRPLKFYEFEERAGQVIFTSATPGEYEREKSTRACPEPSQGIVEQIIRPTGLVDPILEVRPITGTRRRKDAEQTRKMISYPGQVRDFIDEAEKVIKKGDRVIVTTLTKKMAEDLSEFLKERGIKAEYLHSDIKTIDRIKILTDFRKGAFDCLVGVNLLREGLDLPEVVLIGILDADKEGFLRSETSLIQIIGRAARNVSGRVILYADRMTGSMKYAIRETERRRKLQLAYNKKRGITPKTITKAIHDITEQMESEHHKAVKTLLAVDAEIYRKAPKKILKEKERAMAEAIKNLDFETAAILRDEIKALRHNT